MRRPDRRVQYSSRYREVGLDIFRMASQFISDHPESLEIVSNFRNGVTATGFSSHVASSFRARGFQILGSTASPQALDPTLTLSSAGAGLWVTRTLASSSLIIYNLCLLLLLPATLSTRGGVPKKSPPDKATCLGKGYLGHLSHLDWRQAHFLFGRH